MIKEIHLIKGISLHKLCRRLSLLMALSLIMLLFHLRMTGSYSYLQAADVDRVLFISSYHASFDTLPAQVEGIKEAFQDTTIQLDIEYMDSKRFPEQENLDRFYEFLRYRFENSSPYDVILIGDDNALQFVMDRQELFSDIPIVFFCINDMERANAANQLPLVTGIVEGISLRENLEFAMTMHPAATEFVAIVDNSQTGIGDAASFLAMQAAFPSMKFTLLNSSLHSFPEFADLLEKVESTQILFYLSMFEDKNGNVLSIPEAVEILRDHTKVPVYRMSVGGVGEGLFGGLMVSYHEQGRLAGEMVKQILTGRSTEEIQMIAKSPNQYYLDYMILQKYNLDLSKVPKGAIFINRPVSFYEQNKDILLPALAIFSVLLLILFIVVVDDRRQRALRIEIQSSHDEISSLNEEMLATEEELRYQYDQLTESKLALERSEARYRDMALYDTLTGLKNRIAIMQILDEQYEDPDSFGFMYYIDFDNFKFINDSIGHTLGDELLKVIAGRLKNLEDETTQVARIGGDEFMILKQNLRTKEEATSFSYLYSQIIEEAIPLGANTFMIACSMGIAQFPQHGASSKEILIRADIAMHHAKDSGRNQVAFYDRSMENDLHHLIDLQKNLKKALQEREFEMYYQPQLDLRENRIIGFEALIRWFSVDKGMIPPDHFIPQSEQLGLIHKIGFFVQQEILDFAKRLDSCGDPDLMNYRISFNASPIEIARPDYADSLIEAILISKLSPRYFALEITESTFLSQMDDSIAKLNRLRDFGIEIHLDDFGTGYSSLTYLQKLPIHYVKLDRSFLSNLTQDEGQRNLSRTIILLAHNLGIKVIAEGVETAEQLQILKDLDCDVIQGYHLEKPIPEGTLRNFLKNYLQVLPEKKADCLSS